MNTLRLSLVLAVLGISVVGTLWLLGWLEASDAADTTMRTIGLVAIGGAASVAVFAILSGRRPRAPRDASGPPANGPQF